MKVVQEGLEKLLGSEEKEDVTLMGKNIEKLAKAYKKLIMLINPRLTSVEVKKAAKLTKDKQQAQWTMNSIQDWQCLMQMLERMLMGVLRAFKTESRDWKTNQQSKEVKVMVLDGSAGLRKLVMRQRHLCRELTALPVMSQ